MGDIGLKLGNAASGLNLGRRLTNVPCCNVNQPQDRKLFRTEWT